MRVRGPECRHVADHAMQPHAEKHRRTDQRPKPQQTGEQCKQSDQQRLLVVRIRYEVGHKARGLAGASQGWWRPGEWSRPPPETGPTHRVALKAPAWGLDTGSAPIGSHSTSRTRP